MLYRSQHKRTKYPISHPFTHSFRRWGEGSKIFRSPQNGLNHDLPLNSKFKAAFSHRAAACARPLCRGCAAAAPGRSEEALHPEQLRSGAAGGVQTGPQQGRPAATQHPPEVGPVRSGACRRR